MNIHTAMVEYLYYPILPFIALGITMWNFLRMDPGEVFLLNIPVARVLIAHCREFMRLRDPGKWDFLWERDAITLIQSPQKSHISAESLVTGERRKGLSFHWGKGNTNEFFLVMKYLYCCPSNRITVIATGWLQRSGPFCRRLLLFDLINHCAEFMATFIHLNVALPGGERFTPLGSMAPWVR